MTKPKLVLYSQELSRCLCYRRIFVDDFEVTSEEQEEQFKKKLQELKADVAVVCCCSARGKSVEELLRLAVLDGHMPALTCSKALDLNFVRLAVERGVTQFLTCNMEVQKIKNLVLEAIRRGGLIKHLESCHLGALATSLHLKKMVHEIVQVFPRRPKENEMAQQLGISRSWLQKLCRRVFGISYTRLMRRLWVHQALRMMQHTPFGNVEIALHLNYSEESSMARDFRKELGCSPSEARARLIGQRPETLLQGKF